MPTFSSLAKLRNANDTTLHRGLILFKKFDAVFTKRDSNIIYTVRYTYVSYHAFLKRLLTWKLELKSITGKTILKLELEASILTEEVEHCVRIHI